MRIGQSQRQQIAHRHQADIDQERQIAKQLEPELQRRARQAIVEALQIVAGIGLLRVCSLIADANKDMGVSHITLANCNQHTKRILQLIINF